MTYAYNTHAAFEEKLKEIQLVSRAAPIPPANNLNHATLHTPGTEILQQIFRMEHRLLTKKADRLPKCSRRILNERKQPPFTEGGIFLVVVDKSDFAIAR